MASTTGFYAWDLLELRMAGQGGDLRDEPYSQRLVMLGNLFAALGEELAALLHLANTAITTEAKLAMLANRKWNCVFASARLLSPLRDKPGAEFRAA